MHSFASTFVLAAEGGGGLPLGINPYLLGAQILNFLILFYILQRWAFPALMKTLDERAATIREGVENAERSKAELANAEQQRASIVLQAQQRAQQIVSDATTAGERQRAQIEEEAKVRADEIAAQGRQRILQESAQARNALRQEIADIAIDAASRVVGESLDGPRQRRLVEEFVSQTPEVK